jgi:magnesium-dependent phosphatase 1
MIFIFDLDFTLWNCGGTWCDQTMPPYRNLNNNLIIDDEGLQIKLFAQTLEILEQIRSQNIQMAVASRTSAPDWARQLLMLFDIEKFFDYIEIYPGSKIVHLNEIGRNSGFRYKEMFFFDDEHRNINDVKSLGVNCYFVENGINMEIINEALEKYIRLSKF